VLPNDNVDEIVSVLKRARSGDVINTFHEGFSSDDDYLYDDNENDEYAVNTNVQHKASATVRTPPPSGNINLVSILKHGSNFYNDDDDDESDETSTISIQYGDLNEKNKKTVDEQNKSGRFNPIANELNPAEAML
jgi:hypothetical protein